MLRASLLLVVCSALIAADAPKNDKAEKKDQYLIQGTWIITSITRDGKEQAEGKDRKIIFKGDKMVHGEESEGIPFKLDSSKKPKHVDVEFAPDKTGLGLYELDGDTLKICHGELGAARPKELKSPEGSKLTLVVLKREKK